MAAAAKHGTSWLPQEAILIPYAVFVTFHTASTCPFHRIFLSLTNIPTCLTIDERILFLNKFILPFSLHLP
jgi:hypothetical protein